MSLILPRDILDKFERRWTARAAQAEKFHVKADRLKQGAKAVPEGARPLAASEPRGHTPLEPPVPKKEPLG